MATCNSYTYTTAKSPQFRAIPGLSVLVLASWNAMILAATHDFRTDLSNGSLQQVKANLVVKGDLRIESKGEKKEVQELPLQVTADFFYDEKIVDTNPLRRAVRHYQRAEAAIKVDSNQLDQKLAEEHRWIVVNVDKERTTLFSPIGHLSRDELDLINVQCNSLHIYGLLPKEPKSIGQTWNHDNQAIAALLNLDAVTKSDIESKLTEVNDRVGVIESVGSVSGAVGGVATDINLKAKCHFDFELKQVTGFAIAIQEKRSESPTEPGFEVIAQLRLAMRPISESNFLTDQVLAGLPADTKPENMLLSFDSTRGGFGFLHERRWHVMLDRPNVTVLRLVDGGDFIGQCNVSSLSDLPAGKHLSLEKFQADVQQSLADSFGQFLEASQTTNQDGLRVLRVSAAGAVSDVPIHWIYYHLANDQGRRVSCVFTMQAKLAERFRAADTTIVNSLQLRERHEPDDNSPTPAGSRQAAANAKTTLSSSSDAR